ncbi:MAG: hypothetical protein H0U49_05595, partial [Parachlamydiaceae bacterium]|nr:hypothetical protein [Parachlamydiaceae bacterium]
FLVGAAASVFYRVTLERFCQYRFALLSCAAAGSFEIAKPGLTALISAAAFSSLSALGTALVLMTPFAICGAAIISVTNQNVNERYLKMVLRGETSRTKIISKAPAGKKDTQKPKTCCHDDILLNRQNQH